MITGCRHHDHISRVLKELHWLSVNERIQFKTLVLTYNSLNGQTPAYLAELIHEKINTSTVRSSSELILDVSKYKLKILGQNASIVAVPTLWSKLPNGIKLSNLLNVFKRYKPYLNKLLIANIHLSCLVIV